MKFWCHKMLYKQSIDHREVTNGFALSLERGNGLALFLEREKRWTVAYRRRLDKVDIDVLQKQSRGT